MSAPEVGVELHVALISGDDPIPAWVPAETVTELKECMESCMCAAVLEGDDFSFWSCSTLEERDLARWFAGVLERHMVVPS